MSSSYFITIVKEAARLREEVHPYSTNFNRMKFELKSEGNSLVLYVGFSDGVNNYRAELTDKGVEHGNVQDVLNKVIEYITERRS